MALPKRLLDLDDVEEGLKVWPVKMWVSAVNILKFKSKNNTTENT